MVMSEFVTVQNWMHQGKEVVGCSAEDATAFLGSLLKVWLSINNILLDPCPWPPVCLGLCDLYDVNFFVLF